MTFNGQHFLLICDNLKFIFFFLYYKIRYEITACFSILTWQDLHDKRKFYLIVDNTRKCQSFFLFPWKCGNSMILLSAEAEINRLRNIDIATTDIKRKHIIVLFARE